MLSLKHLVIFGLSWGGALAFFHCCLNALHAFFKNISLVFSFAFCFCVNFFGRRWRRPTNPIAWKTKILGKEILLCHSANENIWELFEKATMISCSVYGFMAHVFQICSLAIRGFPNSHFYRENWFRNGSLRLSGSPEAVLKWYHLNFIFSYHSSDLRQKVLKAFRWVFLPKNATRKTTVEAKRSISANETGLVVSKVSIFRPKFYNGFTSSSDYDFCSEA